MNRPLNTLSRARIRLRRPWARVVISRGLAAAVSSAKTVSEPPTEVPSYHLNIRTKPFTKQFSEEVDFLTLPLDTYPNPLFSMSKEEILRLSPKEYRHLVRIPSKRAQEQHAFGSNLVQIIEENILDRPELVSRLLCKQNSEQSLSLNEEIYTLVIESLENLFQGSLVQGSILEYIKGPTSRKFRHSFFFSVSKVLHMREKDNSEKCDIILNYFNKLSMTKVTNNEPLLLKTELYYKFIHLTPASKFAELYSYFFQLNIQTENLSRLLSLKKTLMRGGETERFIARTGWLTPKWHETLMTDFSDSYKKKMLNFFTVSDLKEFTDYFIRANDIVNSNLYLGLLVAKFEKKCFDLQQTGVQVRSGDSRFEEDLQTILNAILSHVMTFKGPKTCIRVLKYMVKGQLEVKFESLMVIMKKLRMHRHFQEALLLMNNIDINQLTRWQCKQLSEEIEILIKTRYPKSPKILIGYTASICGGSSDSTNKGLHLLNDLELLGITHGNGKIGKLTSLDQIQKAAIDKKLTGFEFTSHSLANVYEIILESMDPSIVSSDLVYQLYSKYIKMYEIHRSEEQTHYVFQHMDDRVVNHLINILLRKNKDPKSFTINKSKERFETAKKIFNDFNSKVRLSRMDRTTSLTDLLIHASLHIHRDYNFAAEVVKFSREHHIPFTFNQIYPFIKFHYDRKEYRSAELWYNELVKHSVKATAQPAKELFRIARELGWEVSGFAYRKHHIRKNHKAREERERLKTDPLIFIGDEDMEDVVTEELITGKSAHDESADTNFADELASILYKVNSEA